MSLIRRRFLISDNNAFDCYIVIKLNARGSEKFWIKGLEIVEYLGYKHNATQIIYTNVNIAWRSTWAELSRDSKRLSGEIKNWSPNTIFLSEPAVYALVSRSKKLEAIRFAAWLCDDILPSLRHNDGRLYEQQISRDLVALQAANETLRNQLIRTLTQLGQHMVQSKQETEQARRDGEQARRDIELARRDAERARQDAIKQSNLIVQILKPKWFSRAWFTRCDGGGTASTRLRSTVA